MKIKFSLPHAALILILAAGTTTARGAGFQLIEQNASGLGSSYAGSAAIAENAGVIFFNPAGMTRLPGVNFSAGAAVIQPSFKFSNEGSTGPAGSTLGANAGGDAGSVGVLPNMYLSWQLDSRWFAGLGVGAPFGLKTEYNNDWVGRYYSNKFSIESINVNPSIAYKVNDRLSLGAGINWLYLDADYQRHLLSPLSPLPGDDINARVKINGSGWGWNLGLLYQATPDTSLGVSYRSRVNLTANGSTSFGNTPVHAPIALQRLLSTTDASSTVTLPDTAIVSVAHDLNEQWRILADVSWTGWSSIPSFDVDSVNPLLNESIKLKFRDTWRVAMGVNYKFNQRWTFKGGAAWEQSPVHDAALRPPALPDSDRIMLSVGARYNFNRDTSVDVGYAHLFLRDAAIRNSSGISQNQGSLNGAYTANADVIGIQLSHRF